MSFIIEVFENEIVQFVTGVALIIAYAVVLNHLMNRTKDRRKSEEKRFLSALANGINKNIVINFSDVEDIYKGVRKINSSDDELNKARLARWLRGFLLDLVEDTKDNKNTNLTKVKEQISLFINKAESASPHAGIPDLERSIVRDIENYLNMQNTDSVKRKLNELVAAIQVREESVNKLQGITKWSVPLSVIGLILTVFFGLMSFVIK